MRYAVAKKKYSFSKEGYKVAFSCLLRVDYQPAGWADRCVHSKFRADVLIFGYSSSEQSIGLLQVICEVVRSGPAEQIQVKVPQILNIGTKIDASAALASNAIIRKFKAKLVTRVALRLLPPKSKTGHNKGK